MRKIISILLVSVSFAIQTPAVSAAMAKTYQVTGPVVEMTDSTITVQKGKEKWEITRDANTEVKVEPKQGDKVTVTYRMSAASIEVKSDGKKEAKKK